MMKKIRHVFEQIQKTPVGVQYAVDEKGRKVSVQIDLTKHRQLGEHIEQFLVSRALREAAECAESTPKRRRRRVLKRRPAKPARGA
jgi:hypothetical protein